VHAKDTVKFLEELARKIKKLVAQFVVRAMNTLLSLSVDRLILRSSKATSTSSPQSTAYSALFHHCNLYWTSCNSNRYELDSLHAAYFDIFVAV
jgi:hypothetical protein